MATASSSSASAFETLEMPTLEPRREGFTHSGARMPPAMSRHPSSPTSQNATCGRPWNA